MPNGLGIAAGAMQGLKETTANLFNIMVAKEEFKRETALFNIKKKESKLNLEKLELELDPETLRVVQETEKTKLDIQQAELKLKNTQLEESEKSAKQMQQFLDIMQKSYGKGREDERTYTIPGVEPRVRSPYEAGFTGEAAVEPGVAPSVGVRPEAPGAPGAEEPSLTLPFDWEVSAKGGMKFKSRKERTAKQEYIDDIVGRMQSDPASVSEEEKKLAGAYIKPESYQERESREMLGQIYGDQIKERAKEVLDEEGMDSSEESVDTFLRDRNNKQIILDELLGR